MKKLILIFLFYSIGIFAQNGDKASTVMSEREIQYNSYQQTLQGLRVIIVKDSTTGAGGATAANQTTQITKADTLNARTSLLLNELSKKPNDNVVSGTVTANAGTNIATSAKQDTITQRIINQATYFNSIITNTTGVATAANQTTQVTREDTLNARTSLILNQLNNISTYPVATSGDNFMKLATTAGDTLDVSTKGVTKWWSYTISTDDTIYISHNVGYTTTQTGATGKSILLPGESYTTKVDISPSFVLYWKRYSIYRTANVRIIWFGK